MSTPEEGFGQAKVLAVITARGGSKGLPGKNIRRLAGKPLVAYSIQAAQGAATVDRTIISTDDPRIAEVAREFGAEVPFLRPPELSRDETSLYPVLCHAVQWLKDEDNYVPDYVLLLQPTSPFRTSRDIDNAVGLATKSDADGVVSLFSVKHHPYQMKFINEHGAIAELMPVDEPSDQVYYRRQDVPAVYAPNGAIYLVKRQVLLERGTFYTERTYPYVMPTHRSHDIDSLWDMEVAELILKGEALSKVGQLD